MAQLHYPVDPDGLCVDVLVGLDRQTMASRIVARQPVQPPIRARGLIDTGCDVTAININILHQLGVSWQYQTSTHTTAGLLPVNLFEISLSITDFAQPGASMLVEPSLLVMELTTTLPKIDVLIGLDVLLGCRLLLDGPAKTFTLDFQP